MTRVWSLVKTLVVSHGLVLHNGGTSWLDVAIHKDPNRLVTGAEASGGEPRSVVAGHIPVSFSGEVAGWCISQFWDSYSKFVPYMKWKIKFMFQSPPTR